MVTGHSSGARRGIRMLEIRALVVLAIISTLSACASNKKFSFENIYDDVVSLLTADSDGPITEGSDGSDGSVSDGSDESGNLKEDPAPAIVPGDDEPARWLIKNGCSLDSVNLDAGGTRTWKMRCPNSRWVTLIDTSL